MDNLDTWEIRSWGSSESENISDNVDKSKVGKTSAMKLPDLSRNITPIRENNHKSFKELMQEDWTKSFGEIEDSLSILKRKQHTYHKMVTDKRHVKIKLPPLDD